MSKEKILEYFSDINYAYNDCTRLETLKNMLNELEDVVHGEWIMCGTFMELNKQMCSKCGRVEFRMSDYCPNCGAKMDGEVATVKNEDSKDSGDVKDG